MQNSSGASAANIGRDLIINNPTPARDERTANKEYQGLKSAVHEACLRFRKGVLRFAGNDDEFYRNNIHAIPDFPFGLLDEIQSKADLFVEKEGSEFFNVMGNFSRMKQGYEMIQKSKLNDYAAVHFRWETSTWYSYHEPAKIICNWAGVPMDDVKPLPPK